MVHLYLFRSRRNETALFVPPLYIDFAAIKHCNLSGIDILRNDIDAVLAQIFNTTYNEDQRHLRMRPGKDQLKIMKL